MLGKLIFLLGMYNLVSTCQTWVVDAKRYVGPWLVSMSCDEVDGSHVDLAGLTWH